MQACINGMTALLLRRTQLSRCVRVDKHRPNVYMNDPLQRKCHFTPYMIGTELLIGSEHVQMWCDGAFHRDKTVIWTHDTLKIAQARSAIIRQNNNIPDHRCSVCLRIVLCAITRSFDSLLFQTIQILA